ncbi:unnamed protein product [Closterium sp. Naga37s-1]|nr:unnamed protein product [Closterium sp. Naga37s-1]
MGMRECSAVPSATPAMRREYGSEGVQCGAISSACLEKGVWVRGSAVPSAAPAMRREYGSEGVQCGAISNACHEKGGAAWRSGELVGAAAEREAWQQQLHGREEGGGLECEGGGSSSCHQQRLLSQGKREARQQQLHGREVGWSTEEEGAAAPAAFFQKGGAAWRSGELVGAAAEREARQQQLHGREEGGGLECGGGGSSSTSSSFFQKRGPKRWFPPHLGVTSGALLLAAKRNPPCTPTVHGIPPRRSLSFHYPPPSHLTSPFSLSTLVSSRQPISSHPTPLFLKDAERAPWWSKLVGVERWRAVLHDASFILCPQRAMGRCCGCLYLLEKQVLEYCLLRLDSPIFNAPPAEPLADPVTEPAALPFTATGKLTYSHGMHLKYATSAWAPMFHAAHMHAHIDCLLASSHPPNPSTPLPTPPPFPSSLLATTTAFWAGALDPSDPSPSSSPSFFSPSSSSSTSSSAAHPASPRFPPSAAAAAGAAVAVTGGPGECFPKLRAMAQVLLLPKDLLADQEARNEVVLLPKDLLANQEARKEVCGDLTLALLRRILLIFAPDGRQCTRPRLLHPAAPDPVSSTLLQQLNSEIERRLSYIERRLT